MDSSTATSITSSTSVNKKRSSLTFLVQDNPFQQAQPENILTPHPSFTSPSNHYVLSQNAGDLQLNNMPILTQLLSTSEPGQVFATSGVRWLQCVGMDDAGTFLQSSAVQSSVSNQIFFQKSPQVPTFVILPAAISNMPAPSVVSSVAAPVVTTAPLPVPAPTPILSPASVKSTVTFAQSTSKRRRGVSTSAISNIVPNPSNSAIHRPTTTRFSSPRTPSITNINEETISETSPKDPPSVQLNMKERLRRDNHNIVEQRRRTHINNVINEIEGLLPKSYFPNVGDGHPSQSVVLTRAVDYINDQKNATALREAWENMTAGVLPLLDLVRNLEQKVTLLRTPFPQRSPALLQQLTHLMAVIQSADIENPSSPDVVTMDMPLSQTSPCDGTGSVPVRSSPQEGSTITSGGDNVAYSDLLEEMNGMEQFSHPATSDEKAAEEYKSSIFGMHSGADTPCGMDVENTIDIPCLEDWDLDDLLDI